MRVITGTARGRRLETLSGEDVRPTADRVKEAIFSILQFDIEGRHFLDLFAGSGQMGIEALSRGADFAAFAENNRKAYDCIGDNLVFTKLNDRARVFFMDALGALRVLESEEPFDIIFLDPPYGKGLERDVLGYLQNSSLMTADTTIILEASLNEETDWVEDLGYRIRKVKKYKTNKHLFIEMDEDDE